MTEPVGEADVIEAPLFRSVNMLPAAAVVCGEDCDCREGEGS